MDPDRVRAYLQIACAGLGFDIGEIWWTHNVDNGSSSALAAIEEKDDTGSALVSQNMRLRFVQLYTSKSYENRRNMLVRPADEEENYNDKVNGNDASDDESASNLQKHVLSPTMVDAISKTAQVVWAHTRKSEGLTGRSEMRLQTAVGMPVAVDQEGNMCVVVMFSPNNISSTDDAMEYLQSISRSATSTSIPSLLPAFDPKQGLISLPHHHQSSNDVIPMLNNILSDGVVTRFVSLDDNPMENNQLAIPEVHSDHDLASAPRDCFGIPMLPAVAELGSSTPKRSEEYGETVTDAFDEASYGVWSTIMDTFDSPAVPGDDSAPSHSENFSEPVTITELNSSGSQGDMNTELTTIMKPSMAIDRQERLHEFASAFLEVSVFDLAEVWLPLGNGSDSLGLVTSITSTKSNYPLNDFTMESEKCLIKFWSGAVGRAFASGNPVWSFNRDVLADSGRLKLFEQARIETALAVPVFSGKSNTPAFVFCCYSFVRTGSVPFVLKFVQQALKLLWGGLDKVQPHESVGEDLWRDVAPADLGEMAADVEMHQHFIIKKRPIGSVLNEPYEQNDVDDDLAVQIETLEGPSGTPTAASIYTGRGRTDYGNAEDQYHEESFPSPAQPIQYQTFQSVQNHLHDAIKAVAGMQTAHQRVATNASGSKRAHVFHQESPKLSYIQSPQQQQQQMYLHSQKDFLHLQEDFVSQQQQQPAHLVQTPFAQMDQQGYAQFAQPFLSQPTQVHQSQHTQGQQVYTGTQAPNTNAQNSGFLPAVSTALPLGRPLPFPNPVVNPQPTGATHMKRGSSDSVNDLLQDPSLLQPTPQFDSTPFSDKGMNTFELGDTMQQQQQQHFPPQQNMQHLYGNTAFLDQSPSTTAQSEPTPTPVYSVPVDQLSANGISFDPLQHHKNVSSSPVFCMPTTASIQSAATNGKCCRIQGCTDPAVSRRPYCVRHSGNRICEQDGCNKCAQGSTRFCIAHGGGRRCTHPGCDKGARDKFFCAAHGGGKRCRFGDCNKSAVGGSSFCTAHGGGRRCSVEGCDKSAQSSTTFCVKHGGGKKCSHPGCEKVARGRTQYCAAHGGGVRCKLAGCNRVAIGKLQLCRAHGGGAKPKSSSQPSIQQQAMAAMMFGNSNNTGAHI